VILSFLNDLMLTSRRVCFEEEGHRSYMTFNRSDNNKTFISQAAMLSNKGVFFNKTLLKEHKIVDSCFERAKGYLDGDIEYLSSNTNEEVRKYILNVFRDTLANEYGQNTLRVFQDFYGNTKFDIEHGLLFYYKVVSRVDPSNSLIDKALGLLYYLAGHQLDEEFRQISRLARGNFLNPKFQLNSEEFRWEQCPFVLRKYMLFLSKPEGFNAYYFEKSNLAQIAYLMLRGNTLEVAEKTIDDSKGGLFYDYLPLDIENLLMPGILTNSFNLSEMNDKFKHIYEDEDENEVMSGVMDDVYKIYSKKVKQIMINWNGSVVHHILGEASKNPYLSSSEFTIYHVSPQRIGFLLKNNIELKEVLPTLWTYLKPVNEVDLGLMFEGEFL